MINLCGPSSKLLPVHNPVVPLPQSKNWPSSSEHKNLTSSLAVHLMVGLDVLRSLVDPRTMVGAVLSKYRRRIFSHLVADTSRNIGGGGGGGGRTGEIFNAKWISVSV
jgi:hypothetical protein